MMPKWIQNGSQNQPEIPKTPEKGMPKMMLKFDAENESQKYGFGCQKDSPDAVRAKLDAGMLA